MKKREPEALWRVEQLLTQLVGRQLKLPVGSVGRVERVFIWNSNNYETSKRWISIISIGVK